MCDCNNNCNSCNNGWGGSNCGGYGIWIIIALIVIICIASDNGNGCF